jgi:hypothetical protein
MTDLRDGRNIGAGALLTVSLRHPGFAEMTIRALVILVAICFSANAFAKDKLPKVGNKPLVLVKPKEPTGCKLVGTVKGTKLWAGDCVASELRGATPATETESLPEQAPPGQKQ